MESDHNSGQYRSQIWTVNDVSNPTENSDCHELQNYYDKKLLSHLLPLRVGKRGIASAQRPAFADDVNGGSQYKDSNDIEKHDDNGRECMGYPETPTKPTHTKHPWHQRC